MRPATLIALLALLALLAVDAEAQRAGDSVLARPVSISAKHEGLGGVLLRLRAEHALPLAWSGDVLPADRRVTLSLKDEPLGSALTTLLEPSGLGFAITREGTVVIVPAPSGSTPSEPSHTDARLATGVRRLDQIVVMGSPVAGGPGREQPAAVSIAGPAKVDAAAHTRVADLVRTMLPGLMLWDRGAGGPPPSVAAVRGVSSFTTRGLKTYIDDIEVASPDLFTIIDGRSVERLEVLRGPQGAALYGPDALSGVLQIITRKGTMESGFEGGAVASAGPYQRPDLPDASLTQDYALKLGGGGKQMSGEVNGSFAQTGTDAGVPWQQSWAMQGGGRVVAGSVVISGSARAGRYEYGVERPGADVPTASLPQGLEERGAGVTVRHGITENWQHALTLGSHWISGAREADRSVLTPRLPLGATHETASRTSIRYATTATLPVATNEMSISGGAEYSHRNVERLERRVAAVRDLRPLYEDEINSTGLFGQSRLRLGNHLVVSGGARAEWISTVGSHEGASWASTAGLSWYQPIGASLLRFRGAWGNGIRPPEPGMSRAMATATLVQVANPDLRAESQHGYEVGAELHAGEAVFASVTWYDQRADDLIQQVLVRNDVDAPRAYQFQNLGAISNRGVELEAGWRGGRFVVAGALYLNQSEVLQVAPRYSGEFQAGDAVPEVPEGAGVGRVSYSAGRLTAEVGVTWLGAWTGYDWAATLEPVTTRELDREYWIEYPASWRPWLAAAVELGRGMRMFARVDNPGQNTIQVRDNVTPPVGRIAMVGVDWRR
jgi:iron complex outermembrane receptor protein